MNSNSDENDENDDNGEHEDDDIMSKQTVQTIPENLLVLQGAQSGDNHNDDYEFKQGVGNNDKRGDINNLDEGEDDNDDGVKSSLQSGAVQVGILNFVLFYCCTQNSPFQKIRASLITWPIRLQQP